MYSELLAVHTLMRRGGSLVTESLTQLMSGQASNIKTLAGVTGWFVDFVHHHHQSEDDLFWPVLRSLFPEAVAELDRLTTEHKVLDEELLGLATAIQALSAIVTNGDPDSLAEVADAGRRCAQKVERVLGDHLDAEEPVLQELFGRVPDVDVIRLRKAIVQSAPKRGPHLVFGLLEDPEPVPGYAEMSANFPAILRMLHGVLLWRYRLTKEALSVGPSAAAGNDERS